MSLQRTIINISVPPTMGQQMKAMAVEEDETVSELMRKAFRVYQLQKEWSRFRRLGEQTAPAMGIESYDDVERIAG